MRDMNLGRGTTPHCWRTTFSTWANENGFRPDAIERQLTHVESNKVRATYNKALLLDQRRLLLQVWAGYLSAAEHSGAEYTWSPLPDRATSLSARPRVVKTG